MVSENFSGLFGAQAAGLAAGSRVAGYRLEERIGSGGMAVVFRARDERLHRQVAMKVLSPALVADEEFRRRFVRESRAAAAVDDPHIIPVFEAGEAEGVLFIAMRYVPGGDVRTLLRRVGPLSPARAMAIISPVASALDAAHGAGLVHRDVKPANMLVDARPDRPDHVYLSDFGLSKGMISSGPTMSGQFLGTADYSAPEQIAGKPVDGRADQYSLACAAFELLCGEAPFPRAHVTAVIWAHMSESAPMLSSRRPGLPPAVDGVLARALAKEPGHRYASCQEFAEALRETLGLAPYNSAYGDGPPAGNGRNAQHASSYRAPGDLLGEAATQTNRAPVWRPGEIPEAGQLESGKHRTGTGRDRGRRRAGALPVVLSLAAVVAILGAVIGLVITRGPSSPPRATPPQLTAAYVFPPQRYGNGLLITRRWTLSGKQGSRLTETVTARNATGKQIAAWFMDSIPAAITNTVQPVRFSPGTVKIVQADPVVEWYLRVPAHHTVTVGYVTAVQAKGATAARLAGWAKGLDAVEERLNMPAKKHPSPVKTVPFPTFTTQTAEAPTSTPSADNLNPYPTYSCDPKVVTCQPNPSSSPSPSPSPGGEGF
jgi:serine/threonine-protein kinase